MRVKELEGPLLDYWVAKALGEKPSISPVDGLCRIDWRLDPVPCQSDPGHVFQPSTNWNQGGPVIERENISLDTGDGEWSALHGTTFDCSAGLPPLGDIFSAQTPLVAAMRAYVASKYGKEVPDEI